MGKSTKLDLASANTMMAAAIRRAMEIGIEVSVVIADVGGVEIAASRMDGASAVSMAAAGAKAVNCALGRRDAKEFVKLFETKPASITFLNGVLPRPISPGLGGLVIRIDGAFAGAVGISGGSGEQDDDCAMAALASLAGEA